MSASTPGSIGRGYVQIYTGNCKGKTTAALGLAFRAMGHGLKTYIGQFIKGHPYGEVKSAQMVAPYITIEQYGQGCLLLQDGELPPAEDVDAGRKGLAIANEVLLSGGYDIVVLDEIFTACYYQIVTVDEILEIVRKKPPGMELILTGRHAPQEVIDVADLVTEMTEVKHYYHQGVAARTGIER